MLALLALGAPGGCSTPPGVVFERTDAEVRWPAPPDEARIRYVGRLVSDRDLKPARSGLQGVGDFLFGRDEARGMASPIAVCTDGGDRVFVADPGVGGVHAFNLRTRKYELWRTPEDEVPLLQPVGVALNSTGQLLVSDSAAGLVFVFDAGGRLLGTLGEGLLERPVGIAVDPIDGRLFIADAGSHQVVVLAPDGEEVARVGGRGPGPGEFNYPTYVALDEEGRLYISDTLNFRVQVLGRDLEFLRSIGSKGDLPGYFAQPKGVAIDPDGHVYVVDANFEAAQVFNSVGMLLLAWGHEGRGPGEFWLPAGIFIDAKGWIWIADSYNRRVQVFEYLRPGAG
ncbi:MAG: hypothetical protein H6813_06815 [Phycisphaeraceae bacterium]|nr:hypothetical protein [Phycisphaeraceae bacterium]MCB9848646.1 hypothetical protein [Phycisphaeraceae bacterium]